MGTVELITILVIVLCGILLSIAIRHARQPLASVQSPLSPEKAFEALKETLTHEGCSVESVDEGDRAITIRAKVKCLNLILYWVWADRIILKVNEGAQGGSYLLATAWPAPLLAHVSRTDRLYMDMARLHEILKRSAT